MISTQLQNRIKGAAQLLEADLEMHLPQRKGQRNLNTCPNNDLASAKKAPHCIEAGT